MRHSVVKNKIYRINFYSKELRYLRLRYLMCDMNLLQEYKYIFFFRMGSFSKSSFLSKINNFCIKTNRFGAFRRYFMHSRISFRLLALDGYMVGVRKASW